MEIIKILVSEWKKQGIELLLENSLTEIHDAFTRSGRQPTLDVVELYSAIGGMCEMENAAYWRLWSLEEIVERNVEPSPFGILFSDHLMDSWCYRLRYETDNRSSVYVDYFDSRKSPKKLFDGLEEFLIAYSKDPKEILK